MSSWNALHFNKIAKMIRDRRQIPQDTQDSFEYASNVGKQELLNELTLEFAEYFVDQHPSFKVDRFIIACGFEPKEDDES
jgi:hypothetical protein